MFKPYPKPTKQEKKKPKRIPKVSEGRSYLNELYSAIAKWWKAGKSCEICGGACTDVHHRQGSGEGFADRWAEIVDLPLLLDIRFYMALCRECHRKVTDESEWAYENGYSIKRNSK